MALLDVDIGRCDPDEILNEMEKDDIITWRASPICGVYDEETCILWPLPMSRVPSACRRAGRSRVPWMPCIWWWSGNNLLYIEFIIDDKEDGMATCWLPRGDVVGPLRHR